MAYFLILFIAWFYQINGKDLGNFGTTFVIEEEDLLKILKMRMAKSILVQEEIKKSFLQKIENPKGIKLPRALKPRLFDFDPTICVQDDIKDIEGKIIISKGTKINPLDSTKLSENLLFFDGTDPDQIQWAKSQKGKWILVDGQPLEIEKNEHKAVYFDQGGYLIQKLGIKALPSVVEQNGKKLVIREVSCF